MTVDAYLKELSDLQRDELERIRKIVKNAIPEAEDVISYGIPGFSYKGHYLAGYAAYKSHLSFFPTSEPIDVLKDRLVDYKLSRGTIQFKPEAPIPEKLLLNLVAIRKHSIDAAN